VVAETNATVGVFVTTRVVSELAVPPEDVEKGQAHALALPEQVPEM